ncbi:M28 family peptidase, partial [bacterium]|nr:M28 family peptidase [bacterium]
PVLSQYDKEKSPATEQQNLEKHVKFLCEIQPPQMFENTASLNACADYIAETLDGYGYKTERQPYSDGTYSFQNVIAKYQPNKKERVVLGAHYDVCGPYAGADDNASGVAGLLELARLLAINQPKLDYGIDIVAFSTEEPPYFRGDLMGSAVHALSMVDSNVTVKLMVVLEMIGYYSEEKKSQRYPLGVLNAIYPTKANFIAVVGRTKEFSEVRNFKAHMREAADIQIKSINTPVTFEGIDFSDHRNYWSRGMKALMITNTSFFRNGHYHSAEDVPQTLDFKKMNEVVKGTYQALINLK